MCNCFSICLIFYFAFYLIYTLQAIEYYDKNIKLTEEEMNAEIAKSKKKNKKKNNSSNTSSKRNYWAF